MAGITFLGEDHANAHQFYFVSEQVDKARMGNLDKLLIALSAEFHPLLPEDILAKNQRADAFFHQQINDATTGRVQVVQHSAVTLRREPIEFA